MEKQVLLYLIISMFQRHLFLDFVGGKEAAKAAEQPPPVQSGISKAKPKLLSVHVLSF